MKRSFGILVFMSVIGAALAQAPFTIVRPADGAKVREKVHVMIPKNSIPQGGYIGIFLNGKFIEAVTPPLSGKFYDYVLDTKGRGIADGKVNLEAVLYVDYNENPRIVDRSSVSVNVANSASIAIPNGGFKLRYRFTAGTQLVYNLDQRLAISTISGSQNSLGGHPAELPLDSEKIRLLYAVDNAYGNGDGLIRIQPMTEPGKDYAMLTTQNSAEPKKFYDYMMHPVYMRVNNTGNEIFGSVPNYFPMEGTSGSTGEDISTELFLYSPLPTLPVKGVKPGDSWQSRFQNDSLDLEKKDETTSLVSHFPARGEFMGVEWEMGHPCAKIRNTIAAGTKTTDGKKLSAAGRAFADDKVELTETMWFALDRGVIMKIQRDITIDRKLESAGGGPAGGPGMGGPGGPGTFGGPPRGAGGAGGASGGKAGADLQRGPGGRGPGGFGPPGQGGGGAGGRSGPGQMGMGPGGGGFGGRNGGGTPQVQYLRIREQAVFTLAN